MKRLRFVPLLQEVFVRLALMEAIFVAALRAPVWAGEMNLPVHCNMKQHVSQVLIDQGKVKRHVGNAVKLRVVPIKERLGVDVRLVTPTEIGRYKLDSKGGVAIIWLDPHGPLRSAGFEVNDMILEVNGHTIKGFQDFVALVNHLRPHGRMTLLGLDHRSGRTGYVQVVAP